MEATYSHYYRICYAAGSLLGTWPYLKPRVRAFRFIVYLMIVSSLFIPQILYQIRCKGNVQCTCQVLSSSLLTIMSTVKVIALLVNTRPIRTLTEHLFNCWKVPKSSKEFEIMKFHAENGKQFSVYYSVCISAVCVSFMSISLQPIIFDIIWPLNESRPLLLPHPAYFLVNFEDYFYEIYVHSIVAYETLVFGLLAHDCLFMVFVEHICSMFSIVGHVSRIDGVRIVCRYRLENLFSDYDIVVENIDPYKIYRKRVASFVRTHRQTLQFAQLLEDTFTLPFILEVLITTVGLSLSLLQTAVESENFIETLRYVLYILGQLFHLFVLSIIGQKLIDYSIELREKIYNSDWYQVCARSQKLIIMVLYRSLQPCCLTAGRIYIFSLESFTTVLQTSMSYYTVLASFT